MLPLLDAAEHIDVVSIEDAHRPVDLATLAALERTSLALGCVEVASSRVENADGIAGRIEDVLGVVPKERLLLAPDCGLGMLPTTTAVAKLQSIRGAADRF